ncbi:MAG: site-specific DNA-methyltransferase [Planctomycetes bacterium]|nr:site-specific DNA-methyltransferase [Planctomycetota bacterium]
MPTLDWIGKKAVVGHHRQVPYHLLRCDRELSAGDADAGNLLVQGDNLLALKALLPYYAGKVKCIYIDPPYNTGNEGWVYNDNVNSPEIRQWIRATVGKEGEDLSRHDKWLCMMYPRLALLRAFLAEDGLIFVNLDDTEAASARLVLNELFGARNFLAAISWEKRYTRSNNAKLFYSLKDTILVYRRTEAVRELKEPRTDKANSIYKNPDTDPRGPWTSSSYVNPATKAKRPNLVYPITNPNTGKPVEHPTHAWKYEYAEHQRHVAEGLLWWGKKGNAKFPRLKNFLPPGESGGLVPVDIWSHGESGTTDEGGNELKDIFGSAVFDNPKPTRLIRRVIQLAANENSIILDSFAGSGTTAHAVLAQNKADGGKRRFILVEMDETICRDVTAQRIRKAIEGYGDTAGLGGGFRFCKLGAALFDPSGDIAGEVRFPDLAAHVFFTETGNPLPKRSDGKTPLLGVHQGKAVYLLFNGVLGDKRPTGGNVLTHSVAANIPEHPSGGGLRVVYGEACKLGAKSLEGYGIVFRQIPYQLKVD